MLNIVKLKHFEKSAESQEKNIAAAAETIAAALAEGKMVYAFGTGHSHMLAMKFFTEQAVLYAYTRF